MKTTKRPVEVLNSQEVQALMQACSNRAPTGIRNRALIAVLWRGQLRISEALDLMPKDLDPVNCTVRVHNGKGGKSRLVGLDPQAWAVLQRWLDRRQQLGFGGRQPVFCTLKGEKVETAYIRVLMPRLAKKAKIEKRVHAHGLRHTGAFELANEGTPLHVIQQQLGHSNLATTAIYISHLNPTTVVETMRKRTW